MANMNGLKIIGRLCAGCSRSPSVRPALTVPPRDPRLHECRPDRAGMHPQGEAAISGRQATAVELDCDILAVLIEGGVTPSGL